MFKWLARKIGKHALRNALVDLDTKSNYLLIVNMSNEEIEQLQESVKPLIGKLNMVILGVPEFYLFQFEGKHVSST